jgi:23S rRNA (cytidine2498-2'-O)-methyltransferase
MAAVGGQCAAGRRIEILIRAAYLAPQGFTVQLAEELTRREVTIADWHGDLALSPDPPVRAAWAQNIWLAPQEHDIASIGAAATILRGMQRNWGGYAPDHMGRAALVSARLPPLKPKPVAFPQAAPTAHLGAWTLLAADRLLASPTQSSPWINGVPLFAEDRAGPPSRAYLKLWEILALLGTWPQPGERCLDLGASPGGWTFALARLGAVVVAVDRAPLDPAVAAMPRVTLRQASAFGIDPLAEAPVDWLFSDVIAYPARMLTLVRGWIDSGRARHVVCTLKFQGATDHDAAEAFAAIPGGQLRHLFHNKHELTFFWAATYERTSFFI